MPPKGSKPGEMSLSDRKQAFGMMLSHVEVEDEIGSLKEGSFVSVGKLVERGATTMSRLWDTTLSNMETHLSNHNDEVGLTNLTYLTLPLTAFPDGVFANNKRGNVGRPRTGH